MARSINGKEILDVWQETNGNGEDKLRGMVKFFFQELLEANMDKHIGVGKYERSEERTGYRNGYRPRHFKTRVGMLNLQIPQDREGTFDPEIFKRYQRSEKALVSAMIEMFLKGVSTRKVSSIVEELCGISVSKSQLSSMVKSLDEEVNIWRMRPLDCSYPLLVVDARYEKIRINNRVVSNGVLVVVGISEYGYREILGTWIANSESESNWSQAFSELQDRGLRGVEYIVSDSHKGLKKAINKYFSGSIWQRCFVHFIRNILSKTNKKNQEQILSLMETLKNLRNIEEAREKLKFIVKEMEVKKFNEIAEMLEESGEEIIAFYHLPENLRKRMYTSNMIERLMQEYKRRSKVIRIFPNEESCLRLMSALSIEYSEKWQERKYLDVSSLEDYIRKTEMLKAA